MKAILYLLLPLLAVPRPEPDPPTRILIVVLDDVGKPLLADAPTPCLDRVAEAGRTYARAWGAPLCSIARAELVTGLWPMRDENLIGANIKADGTYSLPALATTLPARVVTAGRSAAHRGKWHLAPDGNPAHPLEVGYTHASGSAGNLNWSGDYDSWTKQDDGATYATTVYATTDTADDAIVDVQAGVDLVVVQFNAPHHPHHCPDPLLAPSSACWSYSSNYDKAKAMLEALDTELERLLNVALPAGYTCFVLSDNTSPPGLGGGKGSLYEDGLNVPWMVVGPGIADGVTSNALISLVDLAPTVLEGLGIAFDAGDFDGISMWPEIHGGVARARTLYCERWDGDGERPGSDWKRVIRDNRWKLHTGPGYAAEELYDLLTDPTEETNLLLGRLSTEAEDAYAALVAALP